MQAKEREEVSELQDEVKKLREKAQVQILVNFPKILFFVRHSCAVRPRHSRALVSDFFCYMF